MQLLDGSEWKKRILQIVRIPLDVVEYGCFLFFIMLKLYLFDKYLGLVFTSNRMIVITFGSIMVVSFWTLLLPRFSRWVALWILNLVLSAIIFSDLVYYRYFSDFITIPVLQQAGQVGALGGSIENLIAWKDIVFFLDILITIPLFFVRRWFRRWPVGMWKRIPLTVLAAAIAYGAVYYPITDYTSKNGKTLFLNNWWNMSIFNVTGLLGFHAYDIKRYMDENVFSSNKVTAEQEASIKAWFDDHQKKLAAGSPSTGAAKGKNVIVIQLESFQNFVIGKSVNGQEITPNLNKLREEMMYYSNFYTQVGQGRTSDAEFLTNNSLYPLPSGSVYVRYPQHKYDSLPRLLKEQGYASYAFHAFEKSFWNRQAMYSGNYGLDKFYGMEDLKPGEIVGWALGDKQFFDQGIDAMKAGKQPFYSFMVALSSHHPYTNIPAKYKTIDVTPYKGNILGDYLYAVHYVDYAVGELVSRLKQEGLWDDTILVMYGDHDNGIKPDEDIAKFIGETYDDLTLDQIKNEVPLFLHVPGVDAKGEMQQTAGMIDLEPTILNLLGIDTSGLYLMGNDMMTMQNHLVVFRYGSFTDGKVYFKASKDGDFNKGVCYDLGTRAPVDLEPCRAGAQEASKQLGNSDKLIYNDLIREFR
ncbi:LTA synthase family protein [Cohnella faecalis]|uniref:LTA synthase family protein n=1 Tax=Cohnella faecalis TaxID=2315694 RepID=A0A398CGF4_9BACL|nr:LTA synthase family protein [Cohnella faecalis]RIE01032.1 LTA synthase family protein [Cohnella faecalis]